MTKTTVYLEESLTLELRNVAELQGRAQAEVIREALHLYVDRESQKARRPAPVGLGTFASGRLDVGRSAESLLKAAARKRRTK
jgi:predicted transcriptional regulator